MVFRVLHQKAKTSDVSITPRQNQQYTPRHEQSNYGSEYSPKYPSKLSNEECFRGIWNDFLDPSSGQVTYYEQGENENFSVVVSFSSFSPYSKIYFH